MLVTFAMLTKHNHMSKRVTHVRLNGLIGISHALGSNRMRCFPLKHCKRGSCANRSQHVRNLTLLKELPTSQGGGERLDHIRYNLVFKELLPQLCRVLDLVVIWLSDFAAIDLGKGVDIGFTASIQLSGYFSEGLGIRREGWALGTL